MSRPVVIVDPVSSGSELAPAFAAKGIPVVAVRSAVAADSSDVGYAAGIHADHFDAVYDNGPGLIATLQTLQPRAIIAGSEAGVALADGLSATLTPELANILELSRARRHKATMQEALAKAGLPTIRTLNTASLSEAREWLKANDLTQASLIVKPPASSGSDNVYHIPPGGDWTRPFERILSSPTALLQEKSETVIVQEQVMGVEFAVDTASAKGQHTLAHLIRYNKASSGDRMTVFDHTEFVAFDPKEHGALLDYAYRALDALGIRWGAAHSEIMLTARGPLLIETGARMCGGPVLGFARAATGSSQLERVIEAYLDGDIASRTYEVAQTVVPIFLAAPVSGRLRHVEILQEALQLPTHLATHMWRGNGDPVPRTVDFDTVLGIIALAGERDAVFADYTKVRGIEAKLVSYLEPQ